MLKRNCAGGVVFRGESVFILKNEKSEWVLPKGVIRNNELAMDVAIRRVKEETGITNLSIISPAGETSYEFFSITRQIPVYNEIVWFIMVSDDIKYNISKQDGFVDGGFYPINEAIDRVTYSQDKSLVKLSYMKYKVLKAEMPA